MTLTEYRAAITACFHPDYEFPDSFDADTEACFRCRQPADRAADELAAAWAAELRTEPDMNATTPEIDRLLTLLDRGYDGDYSLLVPLADAFEEAGNPLAAGMRRVADRRPLFAERRPGEPLFCPPGHIWAIHNEGEPDYRFRLPAEVFARLEGGTPWGVNKDGSGPARTRTYPTRSAAVLALAAALARD